MMSLLPLQEIPQHINWLFSIEKIIEPYPSIIQALVAFGTILSVMVSLYIASRSPKEKLEVSCRIPHARQDFDKHTDEPENLSHKDFTLSIIIHNKGRLPVYINSHDCLYFKSFFLFGESKPLQNTHSSSTAKEIQSKRNLSLHVTKHDLSNIVKIIGQKYHGLYLVTQSGEEFKIQLPKDIKKNLLKVTS